MKDYSLSKEAEKDYIVHVYQHDNNTYTVVFADGRVFENVDVCDENFDKLTSILEEQAKHGVQNIDTFRRRATKSGVMTACVGALLTAASVGISSMPTLQGQDPIFVASTLGMITILGTIPAFAKLKMDCDKVHELEKLQFRNRHLDVLSSYKDYPNSLAGLSRDQKSMMGYYENPFHIMNMDSFTEEDLRTIVTNIRQEKALQFVYHK